MNSLLACPQCDGAISRVTQTCPCCGAATGRGRQLSSAGQPYDSASQSVFLIVIDALRSGSGRRRPVAPPITRAISDS